MRHTFSLRRREDSMKKLWIVFIIPVFFDRPGFLCFFAGQGLDAGGSRRVRASGQDNNRGTQHCFPVRRRSLLDGELADIEMTINPHAFEALRMEFYVCRLFTTQNIRGTARHYKDLKHTYHISILDKKLFTDEILVHEFSYYDEQHGLLRRGLYLCYTVAYGRGDSYDKFRPFRAG
jgi:hypothetical protein